MKIILFENVHQMMKAERIFIAAKIFHEVLPTPNQYSKECGMCLAVQSNNIDVVIKHLGESKSIVVDDPRESIK